MPVPSSSARGSVFSGFSISPAMYAAAFHPEYAKLTYISAIAKADVPTFDSPPACESKFDQSPVPNAKPPTMNTTISSTFAAVNAACTQPPTLVSNEWSAVITAISAIAIACDGPNVSNVIVWPSTEKYRFDHTSWAGKPG